MRISVYACVFILGCISRGRRKEKHRTNDQLLQSQPIHYSSRFIMNIDFIYYFFLIFEIDGPELTHGIGTCARALGVYMLTS